MQGRLKQLMARKTAHCRYGGIMMILLHLMRRDHPFESVCRAQEQVLATLQQLETDTARVARESIEAELAAHSLLQQICHAVHFPVARDEEHEQLQERWQPV
jgi:hypothetical protein